MTMTGRGTWAMSGGALEELNTLDVGTLRARVQQLEADLAEADRRAGAAERNLAEEVESNRRMRQWISSAKAEAGYHDNISFDVVWDETLAGAKAHKATAVALGAAPAG